VLIRSGTIAAERSRDGKGKNKDAHLEKRALPEDLLAGVSSKVREEGTQGKNARKGQGLRTRGGNAQLAQVLTEERNGKELPLRRKRRIGAKTDTKGIISNECDLGESRRQESFQKMTLMTCQISRGDGKEKSKRNLIYGGGRGGLTRGVTKFTTFIREEKGKKKLKKKNKERKEKSEASPYCEKGKVGPPRHSHGKEKRSKSNRLAGRGQGTLSFEEA